MHDTKAIIHTILLVSDVCLIAKALTISRTLSLPYEAKGLLHQAHRFQKESSFMSTAHLGKCWWYEKPKAWFAVPLWFLPEFSSTTSVIIILFAFLTVGARWWLLMKCKFTTAAFLFPWTSQTGKLMNLPKFLFCSHCSSTFWCTWGTDRTYMSQRPYVSSNSRLK